MKKYLMLVLFSVVIGGCSLLEPQAGGRDITVLPDNPVQRKTAFHEDIPLPPDTIVLPLDEVAVETSEIVLSDTEITELESGSPKSAKIDLSSVTGLESDSLKPTEVDLSSDEVVADTETEVVTVPARDSSSSHSSADLSADAVRVEIVNVSGVPGLEQRVSERLAGENYFISWSEERATSSVQSETWIKYRPDFAIKAVHLGHVLPGNQVVTRDDALPEGVDIRVIVGSDQQ